MVDSESSTIQLLMCCFNLIRWCHSTVCTEDSNANLVLLQYSKLFTGHLAGDPKSYLHLAGTNIVQKL